MQRPAPTITDRTAAYWRSGADGKLRICRCQACSVYLHPPLPVCPKCQSREIAFDVVSGKGRIHAHTINRYQWNANMPPPYTVAEVELAEQAGLLILSNIIGIPPEDVRTGMDVAVTFDNVGDAWLPVFTA